jgi:hypothetical protein
MVKDKARKVKDDDYYPCLMCGEEFESIRRFKQHVFLYHSDIEVKSKYNSSLEKLVGNCELKRIREPLMNRIRNTLFTELVEGVISKKS